MKREAGMGVSFSILYLLKAGAALCLLWAARGEKEIAWSLFFLSSPRLLCRKGVDNKDTTLQLSSPLSCSISCFQVSYGSSQAYQTPTGKECFFISLLLPYGLSGL